MCISFISQTVFKCPFAFGLLLLNNLSLLYVMFISVVFCLLLVDALCVGCLERIRRPVVSPVSFMGLFTFLFYFILFLINSSVL